MRVETKIILFFAAALFVIGYFGSHRSAAPDLPSSLRPTPTDAPFVRYVAPTIEKKTEYSVFLLGDSMTLALGPYGGKFNDVVNELYKKEKVFVNIHNYARASTNVLSLDEAMTTETTSYDVTFPPLLDQHPDLIMIESFGYNPLSQFSLADGLIKQTAMLDHVMTVLTNRQPKAAIAFVATIAPNKANYARTVLRNLSLTDRRLQAEERMAYIENHIRYAKDHGIPLVNIYEKTLDTNGSGKLTYINPTDYIHPSFAGIDFIGEALAHYVYDNHILPHD